MACILPAKFHGTVNFLWSLSLAASGSGWPVKEGWGACVFWHSYDLTLGSEDVQMILGWAARYYTELLLCISLTEQQWCVPEWRIPCGVLVFGQCSWMCMDALPFRHTLTQSLRAPLGFGMHTMMVDGCLS